MKVFILSAYDGISTLAADHMKRMAASDRHGAHRIVDTAEEADVIIFTETHTASDPFYEEVYWHPVRRRYPDISCVYHDNDDAFGLTPGFFPSLRSSSAFARSSLGSSYYARIVNNDALLYRPDTPKTLLASFWGASNSLARKAIFAQNCSDFDLRDTSDRRYYLLEGAEKSRFEKDFVETSLKSHFVLCPAGCGPSSYRLFECLEMGVTPVVISDDWVPPKFIPWDDIALRVAERDVPDLPRILRENVGRFSGVAARNAHDEYLAPAGQFHFFVETAIAVLAQRKQVAGTVLGDYARMLSGRTARHRYAKWRIKRALSIGR